VQLRVAGDAQLHRCAERALASSFQLRASCWIPG
jgi:hypothetical protein